jgi:hypothetical protein
MKVADLTIEEFRELVRDIVFEVLEEQRFEDEGELRPEFVEELERRMAEDGPRMTLSEVERELQLHADA